MAVSVNWGHFVGLNIISGFRGLAILGSISGPLIIIDKSPALFGFMVWGCWNLHTGGFRAMLGCRGLQNGARVPLNRLKAFGLA